MKKKKGDAPGISLFHASLSLLDFLSGSLSDFFLGESFQAVETD